MVDGRFQEVGRLAEWNAILEAPKQTHSRSPGEPDDEDEMTVVSRSRPRDVARAVKRYPRTRGRVEGEVLEQVGVRAIGIAVRRQERDRGSGHPCGFVLKAREGKSTGDAWVKASDPGQGGVRRPGDGAERERESTGTSVSLPVSARSNTPRSWECGPRRDGRWSSGHSRGVATTFRSSGHESDRPARMWRASCPNGASRPPTRGRGGAPRRAPTKTKLLVL